MNKNSNLQKALKKAFEEHSEPLNEAQWERLRVAVGEKKSGRKFLPWIFGLLVIIGLSAGMGYWWYNNSGKNENKNGQTIMTKVNDDKSRLSSAENNSVQNNKEKDNTNNEEAVLHSVDAEGKTAGNEQMATQKSVSPIAKDHETDAGSDALSGISPSKGNLKENGSGKIRKGKAIGSDKKGMEVKIANIDFAVKGNNEVSNNNGDESEGNEDQADKTQKVWTPEIISLDKESLVKIKDPAIYKKDAVNGIPKPLDTSKRKNTDGKDNPIKRFAIGFTSGYSQAVYKNVVFTDPKNMHMDTKDLYKESTKNTTSTFANLFFDVRLLSNISLSFSSGVQYRQLQSAEDITYKHNQLPFRDTNGGIIGYIFVHDTLQPEVFHNKNVNTTRFVSIPLALNYILPIGKSNELQLTGGVVLNKVISSKGRTFSVNEIDVVDLNNKMRKKISLGYLGGFNYYRQIYKPLWMGVGLQVQRSNTQFNTTYGFIKGNINITNYTFNIKYKF